MGNSDIFGYTQSGTRQAELLSILSEFEENVVEHTMEADIEVLVDESNNGGYYTKCPDDNCDWESPRENFKGAARLRYWEHLADMDPKKEGTGN